MQVVSSLTQYLLYLTQIFVPEQSCTYVNNMTPDRFAVRRAVSKYSSNVLMIISHSHTFVSRYKRIVSIMPFHGVPNHTPNPNIYTSVENDY